MGGEKRELSCFILGDTFLPISLPSDGCIGRSETRRPWYRQVSHFKDEVEKGVKENQYLLLTFMLPNAEGCCTGLQLSAKEVVLGRPDMITLFPNHLLFLPSSSSSFCCMLGC